MRLLSLICITFILPAQLALAQTVSIDNDITGDGAFELDIRNGGDTTFGSVDPIGSSFATDVIFSYQHYIDVGSAGGAVPLSATTITDSVALTGDDRATSSGTFAGENGIINWTAVGSLNSGSDTYIAQITFTSSQPFGQARFIQYLDEDVQSISDDILVVVGSTGEQNFQLLTVDGSENIGVAHGYVPTATSGASFVGWAADEYSDLVNRITGSGTTFSIAGTVDTTSLPATTDPRFPALPVYGPEDVTSAIALDLNPTATEATITVFLGGSPDGNPVAPPDNEPLRTPVHTKFNTYLGQSNFLELSNAGTSILDVGVIVYNLLGEQINTATVTLQAKQQRDLDVNSLIVEGCALNPNACSGLSDLDGNGVVDTYGLVRLDFIDTDPRKKLIGRMSHYRTNTDGTGYSFAFARELRNPSQGATFAMGNTYDPQGLGFLVPNWVEIINLDSSSAHDFTYRLYNQGGTKVFERIITVQPLGEFDIHGGHEILEANGTVAEGVYLIEVIPDDGGTNYLLYNTRYSSNSTSGSGSATYNYAFSLDGRTGNTGSTFVPITNEDASSSCATPINWVEVVNTTEIPVNVTIVFRDSAGSTVGSDSHEFDPHGQFHYNASALLSSGAVGVAEISADIPESLIVQSLVYYHDCELNQVQTAFSTQGKSIPTSTVNGSVNTFLNFENVMRLFSVTSQQSVASIAITPLGGSATTANIAVPARGATETLIGPGQSVSFAADTYGVVTASSDVTGGVSGQVLRVKKIFDGSRIRFDFVMPTLLR